MNLEELKYREVKSMMSEVIEGISKSKDKVWQLLGFFFAIQAFLITDIFNNDLLSLKSLLFYLSIPFAIFFYRKCKEALFPSSLVLNGMGLHNFYEDDEMKDVILYYNRAIEHNGVILDKVAESYKSSFKLFKSFITSGFILSALFILFQISKSLFSC